MRLTAVKHRKALARCGSEHMDREEALRRAVLSSASDAIVAADREGNIFFWNPGAERIFGFSRADAVGAPLDIIIPERLQKRHWDGYRKVMAIGESRYGHGDILAVPALTKSVAGPPENSHR